MHLANYVTQQPHAFCLLFQDEICFSDVIDSFKSEGVERSCSDFSSTEAELLVISQMAKKTIHLCCLMQALILVLFKVLMIIYDHTQTICLLVNESMKLQTKLWYVNIYSH